MSPYNLLLCSDDNYLCHLVTAVESILSNRSRPYHVDVYLILDGVGAGNRRSLVKYFESRPQVSAFLLEDPEPFTGASVDERLTHATYHRLRAPELLPSVDRVLYIDCDVVARADIRALFEFPLGDNYLAANPAVDFRKHVREERGIGYERLVQGIGLSCADVEHYVGAGVLLMNLRKMREDDLVAKFSEYINAHGSDSRFLKDQETLNMVCKGRIVHYHPRYHHALTHLVERDKIESVLTAPEKQAFGAAMADPAMVHFCGREKPWNDPGMRYAADYWNNRGRTPFR